MNPIFLQNPYRSRLRVISACLLALFLVLCLPAAKAGADTELRRTYVDYEITLAVGDTVTLSGLSFSANNTGHYGETGYPGMFVYEDGYNAVSPSYTHTNARTSGSPQSTDSYSCDVSLTVQGIAPGTAKIQFEYGTYDLIVYYGHSVTIPRVTIHVVESGPVSVSAYGTQSEWPYSHIAYKQPPTAARNQREFMGWFTEAAGGAEVSEGDEIDVMFAHFAPDYTLQLMEAGGQAFSYSGSGDTFETRQAIIPYEMNADLHHDGFTYAMWIPEYYGAEDGDGEPVWQLNTLTDTGAFFRLNRQSENFWVLRSDGERPQEPTDVKLRLTCTWGGAVRSFDLLIHYVAVSLPADAYIPTVIDIPLHGAASVDCAFADNYVFDKRVWFTGDVNYDWSRFVDLFTWNSDGYTLRIWTNNAQPGCYAGHLTLVDGNVAFNKPVVFRVLNPDGTPPEEWMGLRFQLPGAHDEGTRIEDGGRYTLYQAVIPYEWENEFRRNDDFLGNLYVDDYDVLRIMQGGEPVFQITELTDTGTQLYREGNWLKTEGPRPQQATQTRYLITCDWGTLHRSFTLNINYEDVTLPEGGLDIPTIIDMQVGRESVMELGFSDGYMYQGLMWTTGYLGDGDWQWFDDLFDRHSDGNTLYMTPKHPGLFEGRLHLVDTNIALGKNVLFRVADENGNFDDPWLDFRLLTPYNGEEGALIADGGTYVVNQAVIPYGAEGIYHDGFVGNLYLDGYNVMRYYLEGNPYVSITELTDTGTELWFEGPSLITDGARPQEAAEARFAIACDWGELHRSFELVLNYQQVELPTGFVLPEVIHMQVGQETVLDVPFTDGYSYQGFTRYYGWLGNRDYDRNHDWFNSQFEWYNEGTTLHITPHYPGQFAGGLIMLDTNIARERYVLFLVADENGNIPEPEMRFRYFSPTSNGQGLLIEDGGAYTIHQAVIPYESEQNGLFHSDWIGSLNLDYDEVIRQRLGYAPEIRITELTDTGTELRLDGIALRTGGARPQEAAEARFEIAYDWGEVRKSFELTIVYEDVPLPTGVNTPEVIDLQVGQETALDIHFDDGYSYRGQFYYDGYRDNGDWRWFEDNFSWHNDGTTLYLTPHVAGLFYGGLNVKDTNIGIWRRVIFRIADENGVPPAPEMNLKFLYQGVGKLSVEDGGQITMVQAIIPDSSVNVEYNGFIGGFSLENEDVLRYYLDGDPYLRVSRLTDVGPELFVEEIGNERHLIYFGDTVPRSPCQALYELSFGWGDFQRDFTLVLNYENAPMPTDASIPAIMDLQVGQESVFDISFDDNYTYRNELWFSGFLGYDDSASFDILFSRYNDGSVLHLKPWNPGFYVGNLGLNDANIGIRKPVLFVVRDEDGQLPAAQNAIYLPENLTAIEPEAFAGAHHIVVYMPAGVKEIGDGAFDPSINVIIVCDRDSYAYERCTELGLTVVAR